MRFNRLTEQIEQNFDPEIHHKQQQTKLFKLLSIMLADKGLDEKEIIQFVSKARTLISGKIDPQEYVANWISNAEVGKSIRARAYGRAVTITVDEGYKRILKNIFNPISEASISGVLRTLGVGEKGISILLGLFGIEDDNYDVDDLRDLVNQSKDDDIIIPSPEDEITPKVNPKIVRAGHLFGRGVAAAKKAGSGVRKRLASLFNI